MTNVIAILILSSSFSVAIEIGEGFVEKSFANTEEGVAEFEKLDLPQPSDGEIKYKFCVVDPDDNDGVIVRWLLENEVGPALLSNAAYSSYVSKSGLSSGSAVTAAKACLATFPFRRSLS